MLQNDLVELMIHRRNPLSDLSGAHGFHHNVRRQSVHMSAGWRAARYLPVQLSAAIAAGDHHRFPQPQPYLLQRIGQTAEVIDHFRWRRIADTQTIRRLRKRHLCQCEIR